MRRFLSRIFSRRKRRTLPKPATSEVHYSHRSNPLFPSEQTRLQSRWRNRTLLILQVLVFGLLWYVIMNSPMFRISSIHIELIDSTTQLEQQIATQVDVLLSKRTLLVIPNQNYFILRPLWFGDHLEQAIANILGVENISIQKDFPNTLTISIQAKSAKYIWQSREKKYFMDENGFIISEIQNNDEELNLLRIEDENELSVDVGSQKIDANILHGIQKFTDTFPSDFSMQKVLIPQLDCVNTPSEANIPVEDDSDVISNTNKTTNTNLAANTNESEDLPESTCDIQQLLYFTPEFHIVTEAGWQVYVLKDDIEAQINKLQRTLQDPSVHPESLRYIDVRFGERVYLK